MQLNIFSNAKHTELEKAITSLRDQVYVELDEHREAINADNIELCTHTDRLDEIEQRLDVLFAKVERLTSAVTQSAPQQPTPLTIDEQKLFLALYTADNDEWISLRDLSLRSGIALHALPSAIESMTFKNIPVSQRHERGECKVHLDTTFRTMQAKHNVITICDIAKHNSQMRQHMTLDKFGRCEY